MPGIFLPAGYSMTLTASATKAGNYTLVGSDDSYTSISAGSSSTIGPFNDPRQYHVEDLSTSQAASGFVTAVDDAALAAKMPIIVTSNVGTAATGVTAAEYGTPYQHMTVLTINSTLPNTIAGAENRALGKLLYTLPAGAQIIHTSYMSVGITQSSGNINADTPDVGLGTTIATGNQALLSGVGATAENILTGQTATNCTGTATVKTMSGSAVVREAADAKTIYLNVADGWAGADAGPVITGTVVLHWYFFA